MNEKKIQIKEIIKLIPVILFAICYAWGGIKHKWIRRFIGPMIFAICSYIINKDKKVFYQTPLLIVVLCIGYGANQLFLKILKRFTVGFLAGLTSIVYKRWKLFVANIVLCIFASIYLGVINPFNSARAEELIIGLFYVLLSVYMQKNNKLCLRQIKTK